MYIRLLDFNTENIPQEWSYLVVYGIYMTDLENRYTFFRQAAGFKVSCSTNGYIVQFNTWKFGFVPICNPKRSSTNDPVIGKHH